MNKIGIDISHHVRLLLVEVIRCQILMVVNEIEMRRFICKDMRNK